MLSELIMSAPGLSGAFETGFLLAPAPSKFVNVQPFFSWLNSSQETNFLDLDGPQVTELLASPTHAAMYEFLLRASPLMRGSNRYVDKTPRYYTQLSEVMKRAPGVPVVISHKSWAHVLDSYMSRRYTEGWTEGGVRALWCHFVAQVRQAQREHPGRVHLVSYERLFLERDEKEAARLFDFLGLKWNPSWLSGKDVPRKHCQLCAQKTGLAAETTARAKAEEARRQRRSGLRKSGSPLPDP